MTNLFQSKIKELEKEIINHKNILKFGKKKLKELKRNKRINHIERADWKINLTNKRILNLIEIKKVKLSTLETCEKIVNEKVEMLKKKLFYNCVQKEAFISFTATAFKRDIEDEVDKIFGDEK